MPVISRFYGIKIQMFFEDHAPPHFHVEYAENKAVFDIRTLALSGGWLPPRAHALVLEWADQHRADLLRSWNAAVENRVEPIEPLK